MDAHWRRAVRTDVQPVESNSVSLYYDDSTGAWTEIDHASDTDLVATFAVEEAELFGLRFQGKSLRVGQQLVAAASVQEYQGWRVGPGRLAAAFDGGHYYSWTPDVRSISYREWVDRAGRIDDADAVAVHSEAIIEYRPPGHPGGPWLTWRHLVVAWFTAESPYPVLLQSNRFDRSLSDYTAGEEPIPWAPGQGAGAPAAYAAVPGPYPADGVPAPAGLPLAAAEATAASSQGLAAWRIRHPDAMLIGARFDAPASLP